MSVAVAVALAQVLEKLHPGTRWIPAPADAATVTLGQLRPPTR